MGQNDAELETWGLEDYRPRNAIEDLETQEEVDDEFDNLTDIESKLDYLLRPAVTQFTEAKATKKKEPNKFMVRMPEAARAMLKELATVNRRSYSAEMMLALEHHYTRQRVGSKGK